MNPSSDEKTMAGLAHLSVLLPQFGLLAALLIWATQKGKSTYASFQALQAVFYHLAFLGFMVCGVLVYVFTFFASFVFGYNPNDEGLPFRFIIIALTLLVLFGSVIAYLAYGVFAATQCFRGKNFRYILVGNLASRIQRPE